jgi:hypothetical protein
MMILPRRRNASLFQHAPRPLTGLPHSESMCSYVEEALRSEESNTERRPDVSDTRDSSKDKSHGND